MRFVLGGASGYLGTALRDHLARGGHDVVRLVRGEARSPSESTWDAYQGQVDSAVLASANVVVNLSGATIGRPWTRSYRRTILDSRVKSTSTLANAIAALDHKPTFLSQTGMNFYGDDRGDEVLTEDSAAGGGFLGGVVTPWEASTRVAAESGARVCLMRSGVVLGPGGGTLRTLQIPFRLGVGGRLGDGTQYFSSISLHRLGPRRGLPRHDRLGHRPVQPDGAAAPDQRRAHTGARSTASPADGVAGAGVRPQDNAR